MSERKPALIAVCGASGVGKSTVALALRDAYPEDVGVIHFDDFQKTNEKIIEELGSIDNWDDPDVTDFELAHQQLSALKRGEKFTIQTKNEYDNPDFIKRLNYTRIPKVIIPRRVMVVEGHYTLYCQAVRELFAQTVYLECDIQTSTARRTKGTDYLYERKYLLPMFYEHVEPQKEVADKIINIDGLDRSEVIAMLSHIVRGYLLPHG